MRRTIGYLAVVVGFLMMPARSTAQPSNALTCPRLPSETMTSWMDRCGRQEERARKQRKRPERITRHARGQSGNSSPKPIASAALEKQPPPAAEPAARPLAELDVEACAELGPIRRIAAMLTDAAC